MLQRSEQRTSSKQHAQAWFPTDPDEPKTLMHVMRKRKVEALRAGGTNALVALDDGKSIPLVSEILYLDHDTVRGWLREFRMRGLASIELAPYLDRVGYLSRERKDSFRS